MFDNIRADLKTYEGDWGAQGFWALMIYRFGRWRYGIRSHLLRMPFSLLYKILFKLIQILTGIQMPCEAPVGRNFRIDHFGNIIVSGYASFGDNCVLRNGVTIGIRKVGEKTAPRLGNNVDIGAGAKLLGDIRIGNNVVIGANAVVTSDVPDNALAVGVPARIIQRPRPLP
jgi:serine O-acetyltransferase